MKEKNFNKKNKKLLNMELLGLLKEKFNLKMQSYKKDACQTHMFKKIRKNIARIKTFLSKKDINNNGK